MCSTLIVDSRCVHVSPHSLHPMGPSLLWRSESPARAYSPFIPCVRQRCPYLGIFT
ncbi:hypothetical protein RSAG8_09079, partial [Rhizoctonia solani AG-8 WAC10335]